MLSRKTLTTELQGEGAVELATAIRHKTSGGLELHYDELYCLARQYMFPSYR